MIADTDIRFMESVCSYLKSNSEIDVIGTETNGRQALHRIMAEHPDAVLFDFVLPGIDGLSLLRTINETRNPPVTICCSRFYSDVAVEAARAFGASYMLYKPVELHSLRSAIVTSISMKSSLLSQFNSCAVSGKPAVNTLHVRNYIVSLGIPSKLIGSSYLTEGIRLALEDSSLLANLSKGLYLEISRNMNTTPARIERCMRNAISAAYHNGALFNKMNACPTNKEFLHYVLSTLDFYTSAKD